jgi:hypothetical protein
MNPELEKQAFALAKGSVSDPLLQGEGFRILKVVDKTDGSVVPYAEAKEQIRRQIGEERIQKEYQAYMDGLRQKAIISIQVREVPLQLSGPVPENVLVDSPLLGGSGASDPGAPAAAAPATAGAATPPPAPASRGAVVPGLDESEITSTPQAAPERVAPPPRPGAPEAEKKDEKKPTPPPLG